MPRSMRKNSSVQNTGLDSKGCGCFISIVLGVLIFIVSTSSGSLPIIGMSVVFLVVGPIVLILWMWKDYREEEQQKREANIAELRSQWKGEEERKKKLQEGLESLGELLEA